MGQERCSRSPTLFVFRQGAEAERPTLGLVREIVAFLERARHNPKLKFDRRS